MLQRVEHIEIDPIKKVLKHATGPSEVSLIKAVSLYENNHAVLYKYGNKGCIGIALIDTNRARICHIAVDEKYRNHGIALQMIKEIVRKYELTYIEAETDREAVGFYKRCNFKIESLGEKYPGIERFYCYLENE
ncbi:GNAT family N-acetyltransferase [Bacillus cereus]|uniref:GNAT family N-acetyltransferase n=1 Tax=Bacillus cereus TaxID=1396 RepID=UPI00256FC5E4|nr:GNAT family N-acetyltransferase [Bacillus cereus]MDM5462900.1 GNAT family N-acetyltransferase [Bacillus cereus]WJE22811.1 GNAT family N-acetyltransferase [Bacillus cereus]